MKYMVYLDRKDPDREIVFEDGLRIPIDVHTDSDVEQAVLTLSPVWKDIFTPEMLASVAGGYYRQEAKTMAKRAKTVTRRIAELAEQAKK